MERKTPKLVFIIGEHIERASHVELTGLPLLIEEFPECSPAIFGGVARRPLHAQATLKAFKAMLKDFREHDSYSLGVVTHSSHLVNYAGKLISERILDFKHVEIWRYDGEKPDLTQPSAVFRFNENGFLEDWPYGWFDPDFDARD